MSDLFNYRNANLIGSVIEGYEYNFSTGETNTVSAIFYIIDKTQLLLTGYTFKTEVYVVMLIDPAYTTYTNISASNLILTAITYVTTDSIVEVKEFPKTTPLVSMENGLMGANIKGYEYNTITGETNTVETTCKIVDKMDILVSDVLTQVYVCVLYSGTTGSNKLYVPFTSVVEVVSFGIIDYGRPSVLRYTGMNFKQDATVTNILFKDITTGDILRTEPINTIQAINTPPSSNIIIQRTGGEEVIIYGLALSDTEINGASAGATIVDAVTNLNALFANAGSVGNAPTITGGATRTINLTHTFTLNLAITGADIVALTLDLSTTGTVPVGHLAIPVGNNTLLIGGNLLPVGSYTFYITAINYYGSFLQTVTLVVAVPPFSNTKSFLGNSSGTNYFRKNTVGQENNTPFYRPAGATGNPWTIFGWAKTKNANSSWCGLFHFGGNFSGSDGGVYMFYRQQNSGNMQLYFKLGNSTGYIRGWPINHWHTPYNWLSWAIVYDGTSTNNGTFNSIKIYLNGVQKTFATTILGTGYSGSLEYLTGNNNSQFHIARSFTQAVGTANFQDVNIDDVAVWNSDQSANIATFHNSGTPIDLNLSYSPFSYFRFGDVAADITAYPLLTNEGSTGNDLTAYNGTVADYVSDTPP